ncbi:uncharacterized protein LOC111462625 isoform X2 [Cucurbita moschata]|nr:uncharacterized protein LOC111462625 isoform X2 [Cucurbita moschata]
MGTKVQCKSSLPGFYPMRDLNNDSNSHNWHLFYGERSFSTAQYHKVVSPMACANGYRGDDKDVVKQKMLEHEAVFKNQVFELHRLYRKQRDLMNKIKSTELGRNCLAVDSLLFSSPLMSKVTSRRNLPCFPVANSSSTRFSISGIEEDHSSLISVKGNSQNPCFFPSQNGSTVKNLQVLESRPTKFGRKLLDLQLPAEEYIDSEDGEQVHDGNVPDILSHNHNEDQKIDIERDVTDLNEPIQLVETNASAYVDPLGSASCHGEILCPNPSSGPNSGLQNLQRKSSWPVSSQPMESLLGKVHEAPPFHSTDNGRTDQSREGQVFGLQFTKRCPEIKGEPPCSFVTSCASAPRQNAPDLSKSWSNSYSTAQAQQCIQRNFHSPFHGVESSGERWLLSNRSELNKGSDSELSYYNRVFLGFSSEYKEEVGRPSSVGYSYRMQGNGNNEAPKDLSPSMSLKLLKDSNYMNMKGPKERGFNMVFPNNSSGQAGLAVWENCALLPWLRGTTGGSTGTTNKNSHSFRNDIFNEEFESDRSSKNRKLLIRSTSEELQDPKKAMCSLTRPSVPCETKESRECRVLDINLPCDPSVAESDNEPTEKLNEAKVSSFGLIDLNLSISEDEESSRPTPKSTVRMRGEIDLEAPAISETEDTVPAEEIIETEHELASKPHCKAINQEDVLIAIAAEAMVSISSAVGHIYLEDATCSAAQDSSHNPLNCLVEMAFLCSNGYESESQAVESSLEGMDTFESMTLELIETKAEEYLPKSSSVPGHITIIEDTANLLQNRPQRGQSRRGRQRRDFQRDILPGLASLSRQEVTEDVNTFGGLMKAMGHVWTPGLTKRNSLRNAASGRGRRRSVVSPSPQSTENLPLLPQPSNAEIGLDKRSLTGWGKTTRRPRRQRVQAGNLAAIAFV